MPVLQLLVILAIIGVAVWAVNAYLPLTEGWKKLINVVVFVATAFWLLEVFGLLAGVQNVRVGH